MSIQSKIANSSVRRKRKMYDNALRTIGHETKVIRLQVNKDKYGNSESFIQSHEIITAYFDYPGDIPLYTTRTGGISKSVGSFIYDVLPVQAYFLFDDNVQEGDVLIRKFNEGLDGEKVFLHTFEVLEQLGTFSTALLMKKYNLVPSQLDYSKYPELYKIIDMYEGVL